MSIQGLELTSPQMASIVERKFRRIFVMLDAGKKETRMAIKLAADLSLFVYDINVWELKEGDPGGLSDQDAKHLRNQIFGRIY